jgi:hypothetical protein
MPLPAIDFSQIAQTAKEALVAYGTSVEFFEQGDPIPRTVKAVVYRDAQAESMIEDIDSMPATCIMNPDDFAPPRRMPQKFDQIRATVGGFVRTYTIEDAHPILAQNTLPLILAQLRAG